MQKKNSGIANQFVDALNYAKVKDALWETTLVQRALQFAFDKHTDQVRKGSGSPYITHPINVAILLAQHSRDQDLIAAGLLHDTLEDTETTYKEIQEEFGCLVADLVRNVTEENKALPWLTRKKQAIEKVKTMEPAISLCLKAADKIDNLRSLYRAYLEKGPQVLDKFNAPLHTQIEINEMLYKALEEKDKQNTAKGINGNLLLPLLREAMNDVCNMEQHYKIMFSGEEKKKKGVAGGQVPSFL